MTSADSCRMGGIDDVGMVGLEYVGRLLRIGAVFCYCLCVDMLEGGEHMCEWNELPWEHFAESQCGGRRSRDRRPNLVEGKGWGGGGDVRATDKTPNFVGTLEFAIRQ